MSANQTGDDDKHRHGSRHKKSLTGLRIDPEIKAAMKELAGRTGKTSTALLGEAVLQLLKDYCASVPENFAAKQRFLKLNAWVDRQTLRGRRPDHDDGREGRVAYATPHDVWWRN